MPQKILNISIAFDSFDELDNKLDKLSDDLVSDELLNNVTDEDVSPSWGNNSYSVEISDSKDDVLTHLLRIEPWNAPVNKLLRDSRQTNGTVTLKFSNQNDECIACVVACAQPDQVKFILERLGEEDPFTDVIATLKDIHTYLNTLPNQGLADMAYKSSIQSAIEFLERRQAN